MTAFLSHKYEMPALNTFFYELFNEVASVRFDVDVGLSSTSVTRLERKIRNADAFVGLYSFRHESEEIPSVETLRQESRYFRLEVDLAVRSGKPILLFVDERLSQVFTLPNSVWVQDFRLDDVTGDGHSTKRRRYLKLIEDFCAEVAAAQGRSDLAAFTPPSDTVAILLPTAGRSGYKSTQLAAVEEVLQSSGIAKVIRLDWPARIGAELAATLEQVDWAIVDVGPACRDDALLGYLHGRFVPQLRLAKGVESRADLEADETYRSLFGHADAGFPKDIVVWRDRGQLVREFTARVQNILRPPRVIDSSKAARDYFDSAALRKEAVFVSYCGEDEHLARPMIAELKRRFQSVFDYKDGHSIVPGQPWLEEIFTTLSRSALGVALVSQDYLESGNCSHEAQAMVAQQDSHRMHFIPVKLYPEKLAIPAWMQHRQYLHYYDQVDESERATATAEAIVAFYDQASGLGQPDSA